MGELIWSRSAQHQWLSRRLAMIRLCEEYASAGTITAKTGQPEPVDLRQRIRILPVVLDDIDVVCRREESSE